MIQHPALVITLSATIASLLIMQALHVLQTGETQLFFLRPIRRENLVRVPQTLLLAHVLIYGVPGCAVFGILLLAAIRTGEERILHWFSANGGMCAAGIFFVVMGLLTMLRPDLLLRSVAAAHPNVAVDPENRSVKVVTTCIGVCLLGFGFLFMAVI